ncbi:uncharacterized protein Dana_GF26825 [Drosophila ananassae]|uniref:Uncharacterized protein n=2 Tax=Drosophila ananassae TaxID=7217 RepID=A0A0P8XZC2_DROAN|nr:uncharacterized protein Dana_GF26825 [Drosophila ananassae]
MFLKVVILDSDVFTTFEELRALESVSVKHINLLKKINSTYYKRPGNSANNTEFDKYFKMVLNALNLTSHDVDRIIDAYVDFKIYNKFRLDLEKMVEDRLKVVNRTLKIQIMLPECRAFYTKMQWQLMKSFIQSNVMKMEAIYTINENCEELENITLPTEAPKITKPIKKSEVFATELRNVLFKYNLRPWGKKQYPEFDEQIWKVFMATLKGNEGQKRLALNKFLKYDEDREKFDKALSVKIGKIKRKLNTGVNTACREEYIEFIKNLTQAMFQTLSEKNRFLAKNVSRKC